MARPKFAIHSAGVRSMVVQLAGLAAVAFGAGTTKVVAPSRLKVVNVTFNAGAKGGTHVDSSIDVKVGSNSLLASVIDVDAAVAGTPVDRNGTGLSSYADEIAQGTAISVTAAETGGTNPTVTNATIQIDYIPLGD